MQTDNLMPSIGNSFFSEIVENGSILHAVQAKLEQIPSSIEISHLIDTCQQLCISGHLAIFSKSYLNKILDGTKTIESRFSKSKVPPFRRISANDVIFLKECAGPIIAIALVAKAEFHGPMSLGQAETVMQRFRVDLALEDDFIEIKRDSSYASLIYLQDITPIHAISVSKSDRRAWVLLNDRKQLRLL